MKNHTNEENVVIGSANDLRSLHTRSKRIRTVRKRRLRKLRNIVVYATTLAAHKGWAAAALTAVAASATSAVLGDNVWPWAIGGFGAAIVYFKKQGSGPVDVAVNSLISIAIGGFIAPLAAAMLAFYTSPKLNNPYALAFILSSIWPFVIPICSQLLGSLKIKVEESE